MHAELRSTRAGRFFWAVTGRPRIVLALSLLLLLVPAAFLPALTKDSSNMANIAVDHPARVATDRVTEIFGLSDEDSMVVVVVDPTPGGVFDVQTLGLIEWLTRSIQRLEGVDPEEVTSLATEKDIVGKDWGMEVMPFFDTPPATAEAAAAVRDAVLGFDLYVDGLVAANGGAAAIVVELLEGTDANAVYHELLRLAADAPTWGEAVHVAGIGAFNARIGEYVEADAQKLNPIAALVIVLILVVAYRTVRGVALAALPMIGAVIAAFGAMGALGVPVFTLTNSVSVILIAIGVCDGIHILGQYYAEVARRPGAGGRELAVRSMLEMWRPVTITSITTIAGFLVISATTDVPPMEWYGVFATIGVTTALLLCLFAIPAALTLLPPRPSPAFRLRVGDDRPIDAFGRFTGALGRNVVARPVLCLAVSAVVVAAAATGALRMQIDNSPSNYLGETEPLRIAFDEANRALGGMTNLDILVETNAADALYEPGNLRRIDALQSFVETLPHVVTSRSISDYVKQMHRAMNADDEAFYTIPDDSNLIAQYFLAYSASASPTDFEEVVDSHFRMANIRVPLDLSRSSTSSAVVRATRRFLDERFEGDGLRVSLAGWANLGHYWRLDIARSQWLGLPAALLAVGAVAGLCLRSTVAGVLAVVPTFVAVLLVYGVMGVCGIWMDFANSVLAALAVGVTVDFAVHTLDRLVELCRGRGLPLTQAYAELFPLTGRALLFNFAAIALGFGVLASSSIPPLSRFGILVVICVAASGLASLTLLPALLSVLRPRFLGLNRDAPKASARIAACLAAAVCLSTSPQARADAIESLPDGREVARAVNARDDGETLSQHLRMELIDRRGQVRVRETRSFRKYFGEERRFVLFFESPRNVRDTGFLTHDHPEAGRADDQWLYLPAMRKVRRVAGSDRGRYFMGTDFTYEDVKNGTKVSFDDYDWRTLRAENLDGRPCVVVEAIPISEEVAEELGYSRVLVWVDAALELVRKFETWDVSGNHLKTVMSSEIREVDGIWTAHRLEAVNHKTGHRTVFTISDVRYNQGVDDDLFTERALRRGR